MHDKALRQRLEGIFDAVHKEPDPSTLVTLDEAQPARRLSGLFSSTAEAGPPAAVERALHLLKSRQVEDRRRAVQRLAQLQGEWVVTPLLQAVADKDHEVARLALEALNAMPNLAGEQVAALMKLPGVLLQADARGCVSYLLGQLLNYIPPGPFLMGSEPQRDPLANPDEQPQHTIPLAGYWIARHPVTTTQFKSFVSESGYRPAAVVCLRGAADMPVVNVTWIDALAYCHWLSQRTRLQVTLPSEAEWEKAARGREGRLYPWGNQLPAESLCNYEQVMPLGYFSPQADSAYGCADMGNAWEWTRSLYRPYPYRPQDGRESLKGAEERVIRGVTFNERSIRCAFRYRLKPDLPLPTLSFRVVVALD